MSATVSECLKEGISFLESAGVPEAKISAETLLSHVLAKPRLSVLLEREQTCSDVQEINYKGLLKQRANRYPLQYLTKSVQFRDLVLEVGEGCLIPRPETEILVDHVLLTLGEDRGPLKVLDIGTGSGNIILSLAKTRPNWSCVGTDISTQALAYALQNAEINGISDRVQFYQTDLWYQLEGQFDVLVSNPPYLTRLEMNSLQSEVTFEPESALFGGSDGLEFFRRISSGAGHILKENGFIFFEVGFQQAEAVQAILKQNSFFNICIIQDDNGINRILSAQLKKGI